MEREPTAKWLEARVIELSSQPDAEVVLDGAGPWEMAPGFVVVPTPGHTKGHCALLHNNRFLFTGDHLDWDRDAERLSASEEYCWYSWPEQIESVRRLGEYRFEWVLPGHGQRVKLAEGRMREEVLRLAELMERGEG
jgi:glyoxylase-like metal-dependent hydrolase (beta-lactamase superfamily II)